MGFSEKLMVLITAMLVGMVWISSLIKIITQLFFASKFGFKCSQISGFGVLIQNEDGRWRFIKGNFSPLIQSVILLDLSKKVPEDIDKKERIYKAITCLVSLLFAGIVTWFFREETKELILWKNAGIRDLFLGALGPGMILDSFVQIVIAVYTYGFLAKRLTGYVNSAVKQLRQGVSFEDMNLKPLAQLPYNNVSNLEKMMYYQLYIPYLIASDRTEELKGPIGEMTQYYDNREYILQETLSYYWLIFYYSRYEIDPRRADMFYERVSATLQNDKDANAKRVLAYYHYGVKNDVEAARKYVREGLSVIDKFSVPGAERELERKLLLDLDELIMRRIAYEQKNE